jgi:cyclopropane fatty-acyl-phospholipid synthase-like methyltransferase
LENKDCCHEAKAENLRLKKDKEELQIENAICTLCGIICTQE